ncbi:hypothetical protein O0L34_g15682 [Tuta absoluta]|nr:hypothetical protein O0L34_g15682 [Tuta absoluta]
MVSTAIRMAEGDGKTWKVHGVQVSAVTDVGAKDWDALVLVTSDGVAPPKTLKEFVTAHHELDPGCLQQGVTVVPCRHVCGGRLVLASTGALTPYDDVRSIGEAMLAGVERAIKAGCSRPVVALQPHPRFPRAALVSLLAALEALYVVSHYAAV